MGTAYFGWEPLVAKIRSEEPDNSKKLPSKMIDFEPADFDKVEKFICDNAKF